MARAIREGYRNHGITFSLGKAETLGCDGPGRCPSRRIHPASVSVLFPLSVKNQPPIPGSSSSPASPLHPGTLCSFLGALLRHTGSTGLLTELLKSLHSVTSHQPLRPSSPSDLCSRGRRWLACILLLFPDELDQMGRGSTLIFYRGRADCSQAQPGAFNSK